MRSGIKTAAIYIHTVLILAMIIPALYALMLRYGAYDGEKLYFLGLLTLLPVTVTEIAIKRCKSLLLYLAISIAAVYLMIKLAMTLGSAVLGDLVWGYVLLLAAEAAWVTLERFLQRASVDKTAGKGESYNPDYQPRESIFENPHFGVVCFFAAIYLEGLFVANPALCNQALGSAIVYLFAAALYYYVDRTEEYLALHKRVGNLPSKRIYGIGGGMLAAILAVLLLFAAAAVISGGERQYTDIREWKLFSELNLEQPVQEEWLQDGWSDMAELQENLGETEPAPFWLDVLFWILGAVALLGFLAAVVQAIRAIFQKFRENYEENGDIVEELKEETGTAEKLSKRKREPRFRSRREQVRYQYRRFIRKHRKGKPEAYETPYEIETLANVTNSEEGKAMHRMYEEARYGREGE